MEKKGWAAILIVFSMVLIAYGYFSAKSDWNTNARLAQIKTFVEKNRLDINDYHKSILPTGDKAYFEKNYYPTKPIGSSLLGIEFYLPVYAIGKLLGYKIGLRLFIELTTFLAISLICAFLAPIVYSFVLKVSGQAKFALLITAAVCLGTAIYPYSTRYYAHSLAAVFLFIAFYIWFDIKNQGKINLFKVPLSGLLLGFSFILEYQTILIIFCLGLYILYVMFEKKELFNLKIYALLIVSTLIPISVALLYNYAIFHNPFSTGYDFEAKQSYAARQAKGFMGFELPNMRVLFYMTFHTTMGIFWQSPVLLIALAGWIAMWRNSTHRAEAILSFGIILIYFATMSGYISWWGGVAFTPRKLIPTLSFFAIPLAFVPKKLRGILIILTVISVVQMFVVTAGSASSLTSIASYMAQTSMHTMFQASTVYNVFVSNFIAGKLSINRGQEFFHLTSFQSLIPFFVAEVVLCLLFFVQLRTPGKKEATGN